MQDKIKVLMVCHGNICRSTMAQSIFTHLVHRQHLDAVFEIDSAATSREEIGNPPHYGTKNKLYEEHIPLIPHRARQMTRDDYLYYDLLIGMDTANIRNMTRIAGGSDSHIGIARALYRRPEVLVLDEATSALDTETEAAVMEAIDSLQGKMTMLIIAHRLSTIKNCDMVYQVEGGSVTRKEKESV